MSDQPQPFNLLPFQLNLYLGHLDLVTHVAHAMNQRIPVMTVQEYESAGNDGLVSAARRFDPEILPVENFPAFAKHRVRGTMLDLLRTYDYGTRAAREKQNQIDWATRCMRQVYQREPTESETASFLNMTVEQLRNLRMLLDQAFLHRAPFSEAACQYARESNLEEQLGVRLAMGKVHEAMLRLNPRQRRVIEAIFLQDVPAVALVRELGLTTAGRVSQLKTEALVNLRRYLLELEAPALPALVPERRPSSSSPERTPSRLLTPSRARTARV